MKFEFFYAILWVIILCNSCQSLKTEGEIPLGTSAPIPAFVVQPGDVLHIAVWQKPELTQQATVQPDGKIRLLMVGEVEAKNRTLAQIQSEIWSRLQGYIQRPEVEVSLAIPNFGIYVFGEVGSPGVITVRHNITVLEALILSRGFSSYADKSNIVIIRRLQDKEVRYSFNLYSYLAGEDIAKNIYLQPGDTIYVPSLPL